MPDDAPKTKPPAPAGFPPPTGKLDQQAASEKFKALWPAEGVKCPLGHGTWQFGADLVLLSYTVGGSAYPCVVVMCQTCGYTMLFNALSLGLHHG